MMGFGWARTNEMHEIVQTIFQDGPTEGSKRKNENVSALYQQFYRHMSLTSIENETV